jgi:hypothetical protein
VIFFNPQLQEMASWKPIAPANESKQKVMYTRTCQATTLKKKTHPNYDKN